MQGFEQFETDMCQFSWYNQSQKPKARCRDLNNISRCRRDKQNGVKEAEHPLKGFQRAAGLIVLLWLAWSSRDLTRHRDFNRRRRDGKIVASLYVQQEITRLRDFNKIEPCAPAEHE